METLQFRSESRIRSPKDVFLCGENLVWTAESGGLSDPFTDEWNSYEIAGCLERFVSIADAMPEDILAFVQQYGPLGVAPVNAGHELLEAGVWRIKYCEPVRVYQRLAKRSRSILAVMQTLRSGKLIDRVAFLDCVPSWKQPELKTKMDTGMKRREIHNTLLREASRWSSSASYKFLLSPIVAAPPPKKGDTPSTSQEIANSYFTLDFGDWDDGQEWDRALMPYFLSMPDLSQEAPLVLSSDDVESPAFDDFLAYPDLLPAPSQRPSPLFNVLAFHFTRKLTLREGFDFCDQCNELKEAKPLVGDRRANKRRSDKDTWFCSDDCRDAHKKADDRDRYKRKQQAQKKEQEEKKALLLGG